ncbi:MAG: monovalent cation:proton antiporter-2 (CPA2) family protein [Zoogloeaceae bacterium]|jgi:CPA2 family monovalent cation:H+ antiporter-2|nr:monovalent cation:proton antiporter-2 (CPA2) family protein [Zoogloeaceae bacterium]
MNTLQLILLLLGASVFVVALCRRFKQPPVLGYLLVGSLLGPHALDLMRTDARAEHLAEFGVVFLMFSIGLEFSLSRLYTMKRIVFGLGAAQVAGTMLVVMLIALACGYRWQLGLALGGVLAMSSTAVLSKLLAERMELEAAHGRDVIGVLLFQDLAVVPLLILLPSLSMPPHQMLELVGLALLKAIGVMALILFFGQHLMRKWFHFVARARSSEIFVLNVLLITLGLAYLTEQAGLSLALGAFVAGMLVSETEYKIQVEEDIRPFRDVLMGLFFVTIGMKLDLDVLLKYGWAVVPVLLLLLVVKALVTGFAARRLGTTPGNSIRDALWLCAGGEFGFVLLGEIGGIPPHIHQVVLSTLVLSMLAAPFIVQLSEHLVNRLAKSEWLLKSMQLTQVAAKSMATEGHAIICGFGRHGQFLARFLQQENVDYIALDLDPERVRKAAAAGETVVFADATRKESLIAAGMMRASVIVVSVADVHGAEKILHHALVARPGLPVVVRTRDEGDFERLSRAGAAEVVPAALETSLMLASHALVLMGHPINRVLRHVQKIRGHRYQMLRGFYHGLGDHVHESGEEPRLYSVLLEMGAKGIGETLEALALEDLSCEVTAIRRRGIKAAEPSPESRLEEGDVVVLLGLSADLAAAEQRLLRG